MNSVNTVVFSAGNVTGACFASPSPLAERIAGRKTQRSSCCQTRAVCFLFPPDRNGLYEGYDRLRSGSIIRVVLPVATNSYFLEFGLR